MTAIKHFGIRLTFGGWVLMSMLFVLTSCSGPATEEPQEQTLSAKEWYEYYEEAENAIANEKWHEAITWLRHAIADDSEPATGKRTYGVRFVDYYPYLKLGEAYLNIGNDKAAFNNCKMAEQKDAAPKDKIKACLDQAVAWTTGKGVFVEEGTENERRGKIERFKSDVKHHSTDVYAVIIGIGDYKDPKIPDLKYTVNDAQGLYKLLIDPNHRGVNPNHIKLLLNEKATYQNIKWAIGTWLRRQAAEEDTVVIYYSGHGAPEGEQETYWVTYDADIDDLFSTAMRNNDIADMLGRIKSKRIITFLDSCYSAATVNRTNPTRPGAIEIPLERFTGEGKVVISASDGKQLSLELDDYKHGVFTYYLLEGLKREADENKDGVILVDEVWDYVKDQVTVTAQKAGNSQKPVLQGRFTSGIPLTRSVAKTKEERLKEVLKAGHITQEQYECAIRSIQTKTSDLLIDALMQDKIAEDVFGQLFQCSSN